MYNRYQIIQPYNQSETFLSLIRDATVKFFTSTPTKVQSFFINLITIEGLSKYYNELKEKGELLPRPYLVTSIDDTPRILDEVSNVNLQTIRLLPSISLRLNKRYFYQDPKFATRMFFNGKVQLARIDQYMTANITHKIICDSYEMAYDIMRYSQSFFLQDKYVTFRNLTSLFMLNIENTEDISYDVLDEISKYSLYVISDAKNRHVYCLPSNAWLQVKVTDHTIETEGIPYEGSKVSYSISIRWSINYSEPAAYILAW